MQLLYLNSTVSEEVEIAQESPAIKAWDTQKLKRREKQEIDMGGFGKLPIKEGLQYIEQSKKRKFTKGRIMKEKFSPGNIKLVTYLSYHILQYLTNN